TMNTAPVQTWGEALMTSLSNALSMFLAAVPRLIGFVLILIIGWIIAGLVAKAVAALLRTVKFNQLAEKAGIASFVQSAGMTTDSAGVLALTVKWFIRLVTLVVAFDSLGLSAVSNVLNQLLLWIP